MIPPQAAALTRLPAFRAMGGSPSLALGQAPASDTMASPMPAFAPAQLTPSENPLAPAPAGKQQGNPKNCEDKTAARSLKVVKSVFGGIAVGWMTARIFNANVFAMMGFDMAMGLVEAFVTDHVLKGNDPISRTALAFSNRLHGDKTPVEQLSQEKREKMLAPISMAVTGLSSLMTAICGDLMGKEGHANPNAPKRFASLLEKRGMGLVKKGIEGLSWLNKRELGKVKVGKYGLALAGGLLMGWAEGFAANKVTQECKKPGGILTKPPFQAQA